MSQEPRDYFRGEFGLEDTGAQRQRRVEKLAQCVSAGKEGKRITSAGGAALRFVRTLMAALREIFDENAYDRFLAKTQAVRSSESYRAFLREQEAGVARKPRCC